MGKGIWKTLSLACPIMYSCILSPLARCTVCCATLSFAVCEFLRYKARSGWKLMTDGGWQRAHRLPCFSNYLASLWS